MFVMVLVWWRRRPSYSYALSLSLSTNDWETAELYGPGLGEEVGDCEGESDGLVLGEPLGDTCARRCSV